MLKLGFIAVVAWSLSGCANQTTFHTVPQGARVYVNGAPCGESPCVYHTRYGFPDRIHVELKKEGYQPADFYLDTEPPQISYLLLGFGSYLFHTFSEEYRFQLKPLPAITPQPTRDAPPAPAPKTGSPPEPRQQERPEQPREPDEKLPRDPSFWT